MYNVICRLSGGYLSIKLLKKFLQSITTIYISGDDLRTLLSIISQQKPIPSQSYDLENTGIIYKPLREVIVQVFRSMIEISKKYQNCYDVLQSECIAPICCEVDLCIHWYDTEYVQLQRMGDGSDVDTRTIIKTDTMQRIVQACSA